MQTRMEKYEEAHEEIGLRYKKNEDLYKKISDQELDKYNLRTNEAVLGDNGKTIDVESIKKILEKRYNSDSPKRRSIIVPEENDSSSDEQIETKEYDINLILEKAKEQESVNYEKNRFKKLRDTQYDILKDLEFKDNKDEEPQDEQINKDELLELINTITQKELENKKSQKEDDALDMFPDLKGSDDTVVLEAMGDTEELEESDSVPVQPVSKEDLDRSFYTTSTVFTQSDFDDFDDLKKEVRGHKIALIIITTVVIVALLLGIFILLNNFLGINFFKK